MRSRYTARKGACQALPQGSSVLDGGADVEDVAVAHDVFLPLQTHLAALARLGFRTDSHEFLVVDHLGADETALEVRVDLPGGAGSAIAAVNRPGAHLVFTDREERGELEKVVGRADETLARGFPQPDRFEKGGLLGWIQLRDFRFHRGAQRQALRAASTH